MTTTTLTEKSPPRAVAARKELEARIELMEEVLPAAMKGQGGRLIQRAAMTLVRTRKLDQCPLPEFIRCVLEAAELGLAIDGKLCHVVDFKGSWQVMPDYKGLIAVARRTGQIRDCYADVVHERDLFMAERQNEKSVLQHRRELRQDPGEVYAAYTVITLPNGDWRYELMTRAELDAIQSRSPSAQRGKGPWATDVNEMRKKTVIKRGLKLYCDDPGFLRAVELTDDMEDLGAAPVAQGPPVGRTRLGVTAQSIADQPAPPLEHYQTDAAPVDWPQETVELTGREPGEEEGA